MIFKGKRTIAIPPGEIIKEQMVLLQMTRYDLAYEMGLTIKYVYAILDGNVAITDTIAEKLEKAFLVPSEYWLELERIYREKLLELERENAEKEGQNHN